MSDSYEDCGECGGVGATTADGNWAQLVEEAVRACETCDGSGELPMWATDPGPLHARIAELEEVLRDLVDDDECEFDHHGGCQTHGFLDGDCGVARARALLDVEQETTR